MSFVVPTSKISQQHIDAHTVSAKSIRSNAITATNVTGDTLIASASGILLTESASQDSPLANQGRVWLRNDDPPTFMFTDSDGNATSPTTADLFTLSEVLSNSNDANEQNIIGVGRVSFSYGVQLGTGSSATASTSIAIGAGVEASSAVASGTASIAIGANSDVTGSALGARSLGAVSIAIGGGNALTPGAYAGEYATGGIAVGSGSSSLSAGAIAIGSNATATTSNCVAIGYNSSASAVGSTAIGYGASSSGTGGVVFGNGASDNGYAAGVALGHNATVTADNQLCIRLGDNDATTLRTDFSTDVSAGALVTHLVVELAGTTYKIELYADA